MSDYDAQLLELLRQLTPDQQQTALDFVRLLNEVMPEKNPSAHLIDFQQDE